MAACNSRLCAGSGVCVCVCSRTYSAPPSTCTAACCDCGPVMVSPPHLHSAASHTTSLAAPQAALPQRMVGQGREMLRCRLRS